MRRPDVFALTNTGLDAFLQAEVGTELNGSTLTILSLLARLEFDPWAEAARWARLPRAATINRLAGLIVQMPLCPQSLAEAHGTAARLAGLLPRQTQIQASVVPRSAGQLVYAVAALVSGICAALALAFMLHNQPLPHATSTLAVHQTVEPR